MRPVVRKPIAPKNKSASKKSMITKEEIDKLVAGSTGPTGSTGSTGSTGPTDSTGAEKAFKHFLGIWETNRDMMRETRALTKPQAAQTPIMVLFKAMTTFFKSNEETLVPVVRELLTQEKNERDSFIGTYLYALLENTSIAVPPMEHRLKEPPTPMKSEEHRLKEPSTPPKSEGHLVEAYQKWKRSQPTDALRRGVYGLCEICRARKGVTLDFSRYSYGVRYCEQCQPDTSPPSPSPPPPRLESNKTIELKLSNNAGDWETLKMISGNTTLAELFEPLVNAAPDGKGFRARLFVEGDLAMTMGRYIDFPGRLDVVTKTVRKQEYVWKPPCPGKPYLFIFGESHNPKLFDGLGIEIVQAQRVSTDSYQNLSDGEKMVLRTNAKLCNCDTVTEHEVDELIAKLESRGAVFVERLRTKVIFKYLE